MDQQEKPWGLGDTFNSIYFLIATYAMCVLPFLRTGFGSNGFAGTAFVSMVTMLVLGGVWHSFGMFRYVLVWLVVVLLHRMAGAWRRIRRSPHVHSRYHGDPLLARLPWIADSQARTTFEPLLAVATGVVVAIFSPTVGFFLIGSSVALFFKAFIELSVEQARVRRMRDAHIEQNYLARRFRDGE